MTIEIYAEINDFFINTIALSKKEFSKFSLNYSLNKSDTPPYLLEQDVQNKGVVECRMFVNSFVFLSLPEVVDASVLIHEVEPFKIKKQII